LILSLWDDSVSKVWSLEIFFGISSVLWRNSSFIIVESEEILEWLLDIDLLLSLKGVTKFGVKDLHVIFSINSNAFFIPSVDFIKGWPFACVWNSSMLH
jgi:hypothetical protein